MSEKKQTVLTRFSASLLTRTQAVILLIFIFSATGCIAQSFSGYLKDENNGFKAGGLIELFSFGTDSLLYSGITDTNGQFYFDNVASGEYSIRISLVGYQNQWYSEYKNTLYPGNSVMLPATMDITVSVSPIDNPVTSAVKVILMDSTGAAVIPSGKISLISQADYSVRMIELTDNNVTVFKDVSPGMYSIFVETYSVYPPQYYNVECNYLSPKYVSVMSNDTLEIEYFLTMHPRGDGHIYGLCYTQDGVPAKDITVSLYSMNDTVISKYTRSTSTDGVFWFDHINVGDYYLKLSGDNYQAQWFSKQNTYTVRYPEATITTEYDNSDTNHISLSINPVDNTPNASFKIIVLDSTHNKFQGWSMVTLVQSVPSKTIYLNQDAINKEYYANGIAAGKYALLVEADGYRPQYYSPDGNTEIPVYQFDIKQSEILYKEVILTNNLSNIVSSDYGYISGVVTNKNGFVSNAEIRVYTDTGIVLQLFTKSDGSFSIQALKSSTYYLTLGEVYYNYLYWSLNGAIMDKVSRSSFYVPSGATVHFAINLEDSTSVIESQGNSISGFVKNSSGESISGCRVLLLKDGLSDSYFSRNIFSEYVAKTDDSGKYSFSGILDGNYLIAAEADSQNYIAQFYPRDDNPSTAEPVSVLASTMLTDVNFTMRKGGILKGKIVDKSGNGIKDASIVVDDVKKLRYFSALSNSDGTYEIRGIPSGLWNVFANHSLYLILENSIYNLQVNENSITTVNNINMELGGFISGTINFNQLKSTAGTGNYYNIQLCGNLDMNNSAITPEHVVSVITYSGNVDSTTFVTSVGKAGNWKMILTPVPFSASENISETTVLRAGFGWSFPKNNIVYNVNSFDTLKNISFDLRKGYSLFGKLFSNNELFTGGFHLNVYTKINDTLIMVSSGRQTRTGCFEVAGIVHGESYYFQVFAEGFPLQFWSPYGNTNQPDRPYILDTLSFLPLEISLKQTLDDQNNTADNQIHLWYDYTAVGTHLLKWNVNETNQIDTFFVYSRDNSHIVKLLSKVKAQTGIVEYSFKDDRALTTEAYYIVTGKGKDVILRSNVFLYNPNINLPANGMWIDVFAKGKNITVKWGNEGKTYSQTDSISLFRSIDNGNWQLLSKRPAFENEITDYQWNRSDSGKVFGYRVELNSGTVVSEVKTIKIDNTVLSQMSKEIMVGKYEVYKTIQQAIDNANDFDIIVVQSGTYREKLNFKGKVIYLHGNWEYGKPPVLDANGDTAIVIPFNGNYSRSESSMLEGFKIQNAKVGVFSSCNAHIYACLFANVSQAIVAFNDSSKMQEAIVKNPFISENFNIFIGQCTFIAKSTGDIVASIVAGSSTQLVSNPIVSWYANVFIENSILYQYFSKAASSSIPVKCSGKSEKIAIRNCNFWETSKVNSLSDIYLENIVNYDPQFIDTLTYFLPVGSILKNMEIGYDSKRIDEDSMRPSAIINMQSRVLSMNSIGLKWDTPSATEKVTSYKIYRVPGEDTSIFYINDAQEWDVKMAKDSVSEKYPVFTTKNNWFIDSTIQSGVPYIYAVAPIDSNNNEGHIQLSASSPISSYIVNSYDYTCRIKGQNWYMMSHWGDSAVNVNDGFTVYHWDDKTESTSLLSQYKESKQLLPKVGYWCKSQNDTSITIKNASLNLLKQYQDTLKCNLVKGITGWNQISSPFPFPVYPSWLSSIAAWEWNADSLGYSRATSLKPWHAYWVHVERDTNLLLIDKRWPPMVKSSSLAKRTGVSWELNLSMRGKAAWDTDNRFGVSQASLSKASELQTLEPPPSFGSSQLYFLSSTDTNSQDKLSSLYKSASAKKMEWIAAITPSKYKSIIEVKGINDLPEGLFVAWISGKDIIEFKTGKQIVIEPHDNIKYGYILATYDIKDIAIFRKSFHIRSPYPNPFRGNTRIEYFIPYQFMDNGMMLSGEGVHVNLSIYNIAGRKVKTLVNGRVGVGNHCSVWNGSDNNMQKVSAGFYMIRLESPSFAKTVKIFRMR